MLIRNSMQLQSGLRQLSVTVIGPPSNEKKNFMVAAQNSSYWRCEVQHSSNSKHELLPLKVEETTIKAINALEHPPDVVLLCISAKEAELGSIAQKVQEKLTHKIPLVLAVSIDGKERAIPATEVAALLECTLPDDTVAVPVSPWCENWLQLQQEGGRLNYSKGASTFSVRPAFRSLFSQNEIDRAQSVFTICKGSGLIEAFTTAVSLCRIPSTVIFPVEDLETMQTIGWGKQGAPAMVLQDFFQIYPSTSPSQMFNILRARPLSRVAGELIAVEAMSLCDNDSGSIRQLELDEPIGPGVWALSIHSTRPHADMCPITCTTDRRTLPSVQFGDLRSKNRKG